MSDSNDVCCPIMTLPDEVLCEIFSLITDIQFKLKLESVCKRFQRISTTQTNSWKRNDKLELICGCASKTDPFYRPEDQLTKYLVDCSSYGNDSHLNGQRMSMNKWAKAIDQLLQRAVVHKLCIHIKPSPSPLLMQQVFEVTHNNSSRIRLTYIEFHHRAVIDWFECQQQLASLNFQNLFEKEPLAQNLYNLYLWVVSNSAPTLESIVFTLSNISFSEEQRDQFMAGIASCLNLKSFSLSLPFVNDLDRLRQLIDALHGKPLNSFTVENLLRTTIPDVARPDPLTQFLLPICENAGGPGITSLKVTLPDIPVCPPYGLVDFSNALHAATTQSLVELWIANGTSINRFVSDLNHLPATFPNLKELHLIDLTEPEFNEALLLDTQFFTVCDETPLVDRTVFISLFVDVEEELLRDNITALCETQGVEAVYGEGEEKNWVTLKKGRGTIEVRKIEGPYSDSEISEPEDDFDDDDDDDDDYYP